MIEARQPTFWLRWLCATVFLREVFLAQVRADVFECVDSVTESVWNAFVRRICGARATTTACNLGLAVGF